MTRLHIPTMTMLALLAFTGLPGPATASTGVCTNDSDLSSYGDYLCVGVSTYECMGDGTRAGVSLWQQPESDPARTWCIVYATFESHGDTVTVTGLCVYDLVGVDSYDCVGVITMPGGFRCVGTWQWDDETGAFRSSCIV